MMKCILNCNWSKSSNSITDVVNDIKFELERYRKFLEDAGRIVYEDPVLINHVKLVKGVNTRMEYVLDDHGNVVAQSHIPKERGFKKICCTLSVNDPFSTIISKIAEIKEEIRKIDQAAKSKGITELIKKMLEEDTNRNLKSNIKHEVEEVYIERTDDIEDVMNMLMSPEDRGYSFVSILGDAGSGKTTIAKKVYEREEVRQGFECFAWIDIKQESEDEIVLQGLVKMLIEGDSKELMSNTGTVNFQSLLEHKKCLIVLDNVRSLYEVRFLLRDVARANKSMSRVLITTRISKVAEIGELIHSPKRWTETESWDLLYKISQINTPDVEADVETKSKLEHIGKQIVHKCGMLPLKVATIGEILRHTPTTLIEWEKVLAGTDMYLRNGGAPLEVSFAQNYNRLPYILKECFLYMALFQKDEPIEARRLCHLWIGEGLVEDKDRSSNETLMDVAQRNLQNLKSWGMIDVVRQNEATKDIEWCKLLNKDVLHKKAKKEEFFETFQIHASDGKAQTKTHNLFNKEARRMVMLSGGGQYQNLNEMENIRALIVSTDSDFTATDTVRKFKYLKVLEFDGCSFPEKKLPKEIFDILSLRYLLLNPTHDIELPSDTHDYSCIQTLNLSGSHAIYVPNILRKMKKLKHLYLGYGCRLLTSDKLQLGGLNELEILDIRNSSMVKLEDLPRLSNLQCLGINIDTEDIPDGILHISKIRRAKWVRIATEVPADYISVDAPNRLRTILKFEKVNELVIKGSFELPAYESIFCQNVSRLSIEETLVEGDPMKLLKHLPKLKELRLEDDEFMTDEIECDANAFPELVSLTLKWCSGLKKWRVDKKAFPKLSSLTIVGCQDLKEIVPEEGLRNRRAHQLVTDIHHMPEEFKKKYAPD